MVIPYSSQVQTVSLYPLTAMQSGVQLSSVATLLAVSHSIEETVEIHHLEGVFFAGFQRMSAFLPQANRFRYLASRCQKVYVFGYPDAPVPEIPNLEYVFLEKDAPLVREWFLVFYHPAFYIALLTRQVSENVSAVTRQSEFGRGRLYQGMVTFDNFIIYPAAQLLSRVVGLPDPAFIATGAQPPSSTYIQKFSGYMENANVQVFNLYENLSERTASLERMENIVRSMLSHQAWEDATHMLDAPATPEVIQRRPLTVLFTDIENFTPLFNHIDAGLLTDALNRYFNLLATTIYQNHGDVDKFLGDGMLAFFDEPRQAIAAARQIQARLQAFNSQQSAHLSLALNTRIGVATGPCVITRVGSADRREVTILGDAVNVASRLQGNAPVGGIAIDEATYRATGLSTLFHGRDASLKGKGLTRFYIMQPQDIRAEKEASPESDEPVKNLQKDSFADRE